VIPDKHRYEAVKRIIDFTPEVYGLIFCRTRKETAVVAEALTRDGRRAEALHGDLSQAQRDHVMRKFRTGSVRILVATDVAARGLDVEDITHVIHYRLPDEADVYTHRGGRTGRAGKSGVSIALINLRERHRIRALEKRGNIRFTFQKLPNGRAICEKRMFGLVDKIVAADVNGKELDDYLPAVYEALGEFDKEELIKRLVSAEFHRLFEYYRHAADIDARPAPRKAPPRKAAGGPGKRPVKSAAKHSGNKYEKQSGKKYEKRPLKKKNRFKVKKTNRFFINVGRLDKINEGAIVRLICDKSGIGSGMIGQIDLKREFSFFEVERSVAERVRHFTNNAKLDGRQIRIRQVIKKKERSAERRAQV
ncbi:MAG: ATP-dependent helicase, partial [Desulfobacterales bacterium]|nr:ATP-dependent helicase [Desulfobacterales bacterium]